MATNFQSFEGQSAGSRVYHCGDGFYYHFNNQYLYGHNEGAGEVYLRCRHYGSARACRGAATVTVAEDNTKVWTNTQPHTCAPDLLLWEVRALKRRIIQEAIGAARYESPSELVQRIREEFRPEVAARVTVAGMRCAIQEARSGPYPPVPVSLEGLGLQLQLHPNLTSTSDNQDNFFGGVVHGPNGTTSVVFVSRRIRRYMRRSRIVFADGTFSSRPNSPDCAQVLQILTVIRNAAVPLVQVLLEGKTEEEYTAVLQYLRNLVPQFRPRLVMTDFETALQNAWRTVFPMARVSGCYWHYCRAILKRAKELGLAAFVNQNRRYRSLLRAFCGIPLLPQHLIVRGVATLAREINRLGVGAQMQEFYDYFVDTWISHPFYESLSVYRLQHRTNNIAESCNKLLRSKTGVHKPGLWHFLSALKKYEFYSYMTTRTAELALPLTRARKVSAVNNDNRIKNYTTDMLNGNISINAFLHRASTRVLNVYDRFIV